ncbi:MAG: glycosyltransferase [Planctomycetota bacterium]
MTVVWLIAYLLSTVGLVLYGFHAYKLLSWHRRKSSAYRSTIDRARRESPVGKTTFPTVLVQVPTYNEAEVVEDVIDAVATLDYPRDRLLIQILDDSRDETVALVGARVAIWSARGVPIEVVRRQDRDGFKAGALAAGLRDSEASSAAEFVAIFDADFVPEPDYLKRTLPLFDLGADIACVQSRWGHRNRRQNWLTRTQAVAVDAHFLVQQLARASAGAFLNFNGTAGVWRRAAIDDAGGWCGDTLTEDLDLSYRAQLRDWRIALDVDTVVRAELPPMLASYKTQQQRWACGSMQCVRKFLRPLWSSKQPFWIKAEATAHLFGYGVCAAMSVLLLLLPLGIGHWALLADHPAWWPLWISAWTAGLGPLGVAILGQRMRGRTRARDIFSIAILGLGACMNNAIAAARGLFSPIRTFVRTPKQGGRAPAVRTPAPRTEQIMAAFSLATVAVLMMGDQPWATAAYALYAASGYAALVLYWWLAERPAQLAKEYS